MGTYYRTGSSLTHSMDNGPQRVLIVRADSKVAQRFNKPVASRRRERKW